MKKILVYITACSVSFTFSCLFYLMFSLLNIFPSFEEKTMISMLFISVSIMVLIFITHIVTIQSTFFSRISEIVIVIGILLIAGKYFGMYPFTALYISSVVTIGLFTYVVVIVITFIGNHASAQKINSIIQSKNKEEY
ncbi:hypothetical protein ACFSFY_09070 [Sporosarcina siberiensis]|uniref:DUF3021 domain-containing protein n=1 Tax=Sporosarcina siberiensis TaxID=1365606 RepID=A0ABW4SFB7_9BACL